MSQQYINEGQDYMKAQAEAVVRATRAWREKRDKIILAAFKEPSPRMLKPEGGTSGKALNERIEYLPSEQVNSFWDFYGC